MEWMSLLYRVFPAHIYVSVCVASWGLVASAQALSSSFATMVALRALLGVSEAGFGPGCPFYMSFFFKREELGSRVGIFISSAPLATSFASSLAWLITALAGKGIAIAPWRLLFLIEGFPSVIAATFAWHLLPDSPSTAKFLSKEERRVAESRLIEDRARHHQGKLDARGAHGLVLRDIRLALLDPKCYLTAVSSIFARSRSRG